MTVQKLLHATGGNSTIFWRKANGVLCNKRVKNLGWLLRHWKEAEGFFLYSLDAGEGFMIVRLQQHYYTTKWASYSVMKEWIKRPVFACFREEGLPVRVSSDINEELMWTA